MVGIMYSTFVDEDVVLFEIGDKAWTRNALKRNALLHSTLMMLQVCSCPPPRLRRLYLSQTAAAPADTAPRLLRPSSVTPRVRR